MESSSVGTALYFGLLVLLFQLNAVTCNGCSSDHCQNGGTCTFVTGTSDYACICTTGYQGANCQLQITASDVTLISNITKAQNNSGREDVHDVTTEYTYNILSYNILSYIGCAISTVCLLIALGTYLWNKKLRSRQTNKIFICLCATMLGLYPSFLALLVLDTAQGETGVNAVACGFLAGLIQFFVLSSIAWIGVEGINTYLVIEQIFDTYIPNFMVKAGLAAWGIPAIIVILTGGIANTNYAREDVCYLRLGSQIGGLLIPVAGILIANLVIFILVIGQLSKSAQIARKANKDQDGKRDEIIERVKNAVTILVLMGLTLTTGYLLLIDAFSVVVQALFILFNSFQSLFIFILYCVRKPLVRQQWGLTCFWCDGEGMGSGGKRVSSASDSLTTVSKFFSSKRVKKYSVGEESLTGVSNGTDSSVSASVSNPA